MQCGTRDETSIRQIQSKELEQRAHSASRSRRDSLTGSYKASMELNQDQSVEPKKMQKDTCKAQSNVTGYLKQQA